MDKKPTKRVGVRVAPRNVPASVDAAAQSQVPRRRIVKTAMENEEKDGTVVRKRAPKIESLRYEQKTRGDRPSVDDFNAHDEVHTPASAKPKKKKSTDVVRRRMAVA